MQLYALNKDNRLVFAGHAQKHHDYACVECQRRIRLRGGLHCQKHFYHIEPNRHCQLSGKGMIHLQIQFYIWHQLPPHECQLEYRFREINRIADVVWIPHHLVFEIQCSPISAEEIERRNRDYQQLGWTVVWILHDQRYNQWRVTAAEHQLRSSLCYFTNLDKQGKGEIYDQFDFFYKGKRQHQLTALPIDLSCFRRLTSFESKVRSEKIQHLNNRFCYWSLSFRGDLMDLSLRAEQPEYFQAAQEIEDSYQRRSSDGLSWFKWIIYRGVVRPYRLLFQMLLEKVCR